MVKKRLLPERLKMKKCLALWISCCLFISSAKATTPIENLKQLILPWAYDRYPDLPEHLSDLSEKDLSTYAHRIANDLITSPLYTDLDTRQKSALFQRHYTIVHHMLAEERSLLNPHFPLLTEEIASQHQHLRQHAKKGLTGLSAALYMLAALEALSAQISPGLEPLITKRLAHLRALQKWSDQDITLFFSPLTSASSPQQLEALLGILLNLRKDLERAQEAGSLPQMIDHFIQAYFQTVQTLEQKLMAGM